MVLLSMLYRALVITLWCSFVMFVFGSEAYSLGSLISLLVWSYGAAVGPLAFLASKEADNTASISAAFARLAYALAMLMVVVAGVAFTGILMVSLLSGMVMLTRVAVDFRLAYDRLLVYDAERGL